MGNTNARKRIRNLPKYIDDNLEHDISLPLHTLSICHIQKKEKKIGYLRYRHIENFIAIWLDSTANELHGDNQHTIIQLRNVVNFVKIFTDAERCIDFINHIQDEKIFLIISGRLGPVFLPRIKNIPQLESIYIFCKERSRHELWTKQYQKIKGVYSNIKLLCERLKLDVFQCEYDLTELSIVSNDSTILINDLDQSYVLIQLIKEILFDIEYTDKEHQNFVQFCQKSYANIDHELSNINEFEQQYDPSSSSSIDWYNRKCFLYFILNKAFRTDDIEIIIKMGYFIRNLHREIEQLHTQADLIYPFSVYRGQGMPFNELERLKRNKSYLLSFNNFLLTTTVRESALTNARQAQQNSDQVGILFQMTINPSICSTPFVFLKDTNCVSNEREEVLFSLNTSFSIDGVEQIDDRIWKVDLVLTMETNQHLKRFIHSIQDSIRRKQELTHVSTLIAKLKHLDKLDDISSLSSNKIFDNDDEELSAHRIHYF